MTHLCVSNLTTIGSGNGLSPERCQAIIWTNAGILLIGPLGTNFSEILIEIQNFSLKKIFLKMSSAKCCSFRLGLNVLFRVSEDAASVVYFYLDQFIVDCFIARLSVRQETCCRSVYSINTLRPRRNGRHFPDDIFKRIFLNENIWIPIEISLKFVPKGSINNIPALVQMMAWRRPGDKPLSELMMVNLPTLICVTRPQWVDGWSRMSLIQGHEHICRFERKFTCIKWRCKRTQFVNWYSTHY